MYDSEFDIDQWVEGRVTSLTSVTEELEDVQIMEYASHASQESVMALRAILERLDTAIEYVEGAQDGRTFY